VATLGVTVEEVLSSSTLSSAEVIAGASGLLRKVQRLNVMEGPDILAWIRPNALILTTGYPLAGGPQAIRRLVIGLEQRGVAGLAITRGAHLENLSREVLEQADKSGFPIIRLPEEVSFSDVFHEVVSNILDRQAAALARSDEIHRALVQIVFAGGSLRDITVKVASLLDAHVLIVDSRGEVLAASSDLEEFGSAGVPCIQSSVGVTTRAVADEGGRVNGCLCSQEDHVIVPIVASGCYHGRLVAVSPAGAFGESDIQILERASTVAALLLTKHEAVAETENRYRADILRDLLNGHGGAPAGIVERAASLGWDFARPCVLVVSQPDTDPELELGSPASHVMQAKWLRTWSSLAHTHDSGAAVVGLGREIVAVIGARDSFPETIRWVEHMIGEVRAEDTALSFSCGMSSVMREPSGLPNAYLQASRSVLLARQIQGNRGFAQYDDLGVYRLLSLIPDTGRLQQFARDTLGEVLEHGGDHEQLWQTLHVLLETNLNLAETARRLNCPYNAVRYRLSQLERGLGAFSRDPHVRLGVLIAHQIALMQGDPSPAASSAREDL
jgi:purine catabolism regulator